MYTFSWNWWRSSWYAESKSLSLNIHHSYMAMAIATRNTPRTHFDYVYFPLKIEYAALILLANPKLRKVIESERMRRNNNKIINMMTKTACVCVCLCVRMTTSIVADFSICVNHTQRRLEYFRNSAAKFTFPFCCWYSRRCECVLVLAITAWIGMHIIYM